MTGDPKRIDDVLHRVNCLAEPIEELTVDPFDIRKMSSWKMTTQKFKTDIQVKIWLQLYCRCSFVFLFWYFWCIKCSLFIKAIEREAINFIDHSFKTLRSSSAAFDLLLKFKHIRSRDAINNQLMKKFNDILAQYCKEVPHDLLTKKPSTCWIFKCCHGDTKIAFPAVFKCLLWCCCCLDGPSKWHIYETTG